MSSDTAHIAIFGASGAIGAALTRHLAQRPHTRLHALSRSTKEFDLGNVNSHTIDLLDEASIERAATRIGVLDQLDLVLVATGLLHSRDLLPEKSLGELDAESMARVFAVNSIGPALVMKHFLPLLRRQRRSVFAAFSARVGSISDNHLGGWYSYRASKAALNMLIKTASVEMARRNRHAIVTGLHPGTVDSNLSAPFQKNVRPDKLFDPDYSAARLIRVIDGLAPADSGSIFAWDGQLVPY